MVRNTDLSPQHTGSCNISLKPIEYFNITSLVELSQWYTKWGKIYSISPNLKVYSRQSDFTFDCGFTYAAKEKTVVRVIYIYVKYNFPL